MVEKNGGFVRILVSFLHFEDLQENVQSGSCREKQEGVKRLVLVVSVEGLLNELRKKGRTVDKVEDAIRRQHRVLQEGALFGTRCLHPSHLDDAPFGAEV